MLRRTFFAAAALVPFWRPKPAATARRVTVEFFGDDGPIPSPEAAVRELLIRFPEWQQWQPGEKLTFTVRVDRPDGTYWSWSQLCG